MSELRNLYFYAKLGQDACIERENFDEQIKYFFSYSLFLPKVARNPYLIKKITVTEISSLLILEFFKRLFIEYNSFLFKLLKRSLIIFKSGSPLIAKFMLSNLKNSSSE